ncbi:uncharacterized protein LOC143040713 isoform X1 [Oratosquilla oratoria]|uniref:uncharacterized protein LOC143040713 isoform X1 n=1 Tax=Oratosquilla oratoria TaxID=337810 RepID=UPI003F76FCC1
MKTHLLVVLATWLVAQVGSREISRRKYERDEALLAAQQEEDILPAADPHSRDFLPAADPHSRDFLPAADPHSRDVLPAVDPHRRDMTGSAASEEATNGAAGASDPAAFGEHQLPEGAAGAVEVNVESSKGTKHRHRHHQGEGQSVVGALNTKQAGKHIGHRLQHKSKLPKKVTTKTHPTKDDAFHEVEGGLPEAENPHKEPEEDPLPHHTEGQDLNPEGAPNTHYVDLDMDQRLEEDFADIYENDNTHDKNHHHHTEAEASQPEHHSGEVTHTQVEEQASSGEAVHTSSGKKKKGREPVVLPVTTEGKNRSGNDYAHYGLPLELMPILPGGGSRFDDVERERLEKASQSQKKNGDDEEGTGNAAESLHSGASRFGLSLLQVILLALFTRIH